MRILCPMCGFDREMDESKIPPRAQMATCPKCTHKFRFRVVDEPEPAEAPPFPAQAPAAADAPDAGPDPLAAQRAAAAKTWEMLKDPKPIDQPPPAERREEPRPLEQGLEERPWPDPDAPKSTGSPVPFEDLPRHGFFHGLWGTLRLLLTQPAAFFRAMPTAGGMALPLAFYLLLSEFMAACHFTWGLMGVGALAQYLNSPDIMDMGMGMGGFALVFLLVVVPLASVLNIMLMTGATHMLLLLLRAGGAGGEATFRVLCYAAAPLALGLVPLFGPLIAGVWSMALGIIGIRTVHRSGSSAAIFAALVPLLLLMAAFFGILHGMAKGA